MGKGPMFRAFELTDTKPVPTDAPAGERARPRGYLVLLRGDSLGKMYPLGRRTSIGRGPDADVRIDDEGISRSHIRIDLADDHAFRIVDLGSRNGTRVNGKPLGASQKLVYGDRIEIGTTTVLKFVYQDDLEIQLQDSQRMEGIGRLAGGVAHEFNNLLTVIYNNLAHLQECLQEDCIDRGELLECIADSLFEARRGAQLTRNLLGFARRGPFEPTRLVLDDFLDSFVRLISRTLERNITVHADVEPKLTVYCDKTQLNQVMLNLGLNARDAMPEGGTLTLKAASRTIRPDDPPAVHAGVPPGPYVEIAVTDTGGGMDEHTLERMFEPFFSTKDGGRATGLGLAVVDGIVRTHNGHVTAESRPGSGTTVHVYLPAALPDAHGVMSRERADSGVFEIPGGTVLVVDDEDAVRSSVERLLINAGYEVLTASHGAQALDVFEQHRDRIGAILLDLTMPGLDGEETFARLHAMDPGVSVIVCSGHLADDRLARLQQSGVAGFLGKPFEYEHLAKAVAKVMAPRAAL